MTQKPETTEYVNLQGSDAGRLLGHLDKRVRQLNEDLTSVHETSRLLTSPMDLPQVLNMVVKTVAEALHMDAAGLRLLDEESGQLILKATFGLSSQYTNKGPVTAAESSLNERALRGEVIIVDDMRTHEHFARYRDQVIAEGIISSISIGLIYKGKGIGILRLYCKHYRQFSYEDISLARTVAAQSAAAIMNARLYREALEGERLARQMKLAGTVQRHLIPQNSPVIEGLDVAGVYVPCYDVGGDFYDFIRLADGKLIIILGDVMGKGVPASLRMASLRAAFRAYAETSLTVTELIERVNHMFSNDVELGEFATAFCCMVDPHTRRMIYCNCGHDPPIRVNTDGKVDRLIGGGTILGLSPDSIYNPVEIELFPNDMIVMFTDGLPDAVNFQSEKFGALRIEAAARECVRLNAEQAAKSIIWQMRKFAGLTRRYDDTAVVVMRKT